MCHAAAYAGRLTRPRHASTGLLHRTVNFSADKTRAPLYNLQNSMSGNAQAHFSGFPGVVVRS